MTEQERSGEWSMRIVQCLRHSEGLQSLGLLALVFPNVTLLFGAMPWAQPHENLAHSLSASRTLVSTHMLECGACLACSLLSSVNHLSVPLSVSVGIPSGSSISPVSESLGF